MTQETMTLAQAALRLGRTYAWTWNAVLRGVLNGKQDDSGRWEVTRSSVEKLEAEARARRPQEDVNSNVG